MSQRRMRRSEEDVETGGRGDAVRTLSWLIIAASPRLSVSASPCLFISASFTTLCLPLSPELHLKLRCLRVRRSRREPHQREVSSSRFASSSPQPRQCRHLSRLRLRTQQAPVPPCRAFVPQSP